MNAVANVDNFENQENNNVVFALTQHGNDVFAALPKHISKEKFYQVAVVAANMNEDLKTAEPRSIVNALTQCAKDGLLPDNREAAIVIYNKKQGNEWIKTAQYQPMIDGVLKRLRQSGEVANIIAKPVYEGDQFNYWVDIEGEHLQYQPTFSSAQRGEFKLAFAMAKLKSGELVVEVMLKDDIDKIMYMSKSAIDKQGNVKPYSVWGQHYDRMAVKTALHRVARRLPNASEVMEMLERDIDAKLVTETKEKNDSHQASTSEGCSLEQIQTLKNLVEETQSDKTNMLAWVGSKTGAIVEEFEDLNVSQFNILIKALQKKKAKLNEQMSQEV